MYGVIGNFCCSMLAKGYLSQASADAYKSDLRLFEI